MVSKFPLVFPGRQVQKRMFPYRKPTAYITLPCATALAWDLNSQSISQSTACTSVEFDRRQVHFVPLFRIPSRGRVDHDRSPSDLTVSDLRWSRPKQYFRPDRTFKMFSTVSNSTAVSHMESVHFAPPRRRVNHDRSPSDLNRVELELIFYQRVLPAKTNGRNNRTTIRLHWPIPVAVADPGGGHPGRVPPSALRKFFFMWKKLFHMLVLHLLDC